MFRTACIAVAIVLVLCVAIAETAVAQGRSGGAPGWGGGGPPGATFDTPFGSSDGLKPHTTVVLRSGAAEANQGPHSILRLVRLPAGTSKATRPVGSRL
jgi:hypothetical protein